MSKKLVILTVPSMWLRMENIDRMKHTLSLAGKETDSSFVVLPEGCSILNPEDLDPVVKADLRALLAEDQTHPATSRREQAVITLIDKGWQWLNGAWVPPA